jgi:phosphoribosyl 1,2-cyclic phosphodiesterase
VVGFQGSEPGAILRPGNPHLILDGGTGLVSRPAILLGGPWAQGELHFLLGHFHWDHIIGLPFFEPMFEPDSRFIFYGASVEDLRSSINRLFTSVYSPLKGVQNLAAELEYRQVEPDGMEVAGFQVRAAENRHRGGALTFRIEYGSHAVVYSSDHETGDPKVDSKLVDLARGANLWILSAPFTQEQRQQRQGWGHSSHLEAVELALDAGVEMAVLYHHDPNHDDETLDRMGREAAKAAAGSRTEVLMARDGMVVNVGAATGV